MAAKSYMLHVLQFWFLIKEVYRPWSSRMVLRICFLVVLFLGIFATESLAQSKTHLQLASELVDHLGIHDQFVSYCDALVRKRMSSHYKNVDQTAEVVLSKQLQSYVNYESIRSRVAGQIALKATESEIRGVLAFLRSSSGKKFLDLFSTTRRQSLPIVGEETKRALPKLDSFYETLPLATKGNLPNLSKSRKP